MTVHITKMDKDAKALEGFLEAAGCDMKTKGLCKLLKGRHPYRG